MYSWQADGVNRLPAVCVSVAYSCGRLLIYKHYAGMLSPWGQGSYSAKFFWFPSSSLEISNEESLITYICLTV